MNDNLYIILENCLAMLDQGSDLESCLAQYPEYAIELRPLLLASMDAKSLSVEEIPVDVVRRSKSNILNAAAEMREQGSNRKPISFLPPKRILRFGLVALITLIMLVGMGGTSLVRASTASLPGDQFYPFKLTWENLLLKLAASQIEREELEDRFEKERVEEVEELFSSSRSESVKFYGLVDGIFPGQISVSGIPVILTPETRVVGQISINTWVRVEGETSPEGRVIAEKIKVEKQRSDEEESNDQNNVEETSDIDNSGQGNGNFGDNPAESTKSHDEEKPTPDNGDDGKETSGSSVSDDDKSNPREKDFEIEGVVSSYNGSSLSVGDRTIFIIPATELKGSPTPGSLVSIRGYVNEEGALIALRIDGKSNPTGGSGDGGGGDSGSSNEDDDDPTKTPKPDETPDD
jgi:hypothetical protein